MGGRKAESMENPGVRKFLLFIVAAIIVVSAAFGVCMAQIGAMGGSADDVRVLIAGQLRAAVEARAMPVVDVRFTSEVDSQVAEAYEVVLSSSGSSGHSGIDDAANTMEVMREASLLKGRGVNLEVAGFV